MEMVIARQMEWMEPTFDTWTLSIFIFWRIQLYREKKRDRKGDRSQVKLETGRISKIKIQELRVATTRKNESLEVNGIGLDSFKRERER